MNSAKHSYYRGCSRSLVDVDLFLFLCRAINLVGVKNVICFRAVKDCPELSLN
jgi:hypothetical protein